MRGQVWLRRLGRPATKAARACLVFLLVVLPARGLTSTLILGGGSLLTDCYALFELAADVPLSASSFPTVTCTDGDPSCDADGIPDGVCRFDIRICVHVPGIAECRPRRVGEIRVGGSFGASAIPLPELPASRERCGAFGRVSVPLRGTKRKRGRGKIKLIAVSKVPNPKRDRDSLKFLCLPNPSPCVDASCPALDLVVTSGGSDLDIGWQGDGHNFAWPDGWKVELALSGCNATGYPLCTVNGPKDLTLGPPFPVIAAGVPTCIVNGFTDEGIRGTANIQTGGVSTVVSVVASAHLTSVAQVCPRCAASAVGDAGTCDAGPNQGLPCTVEGVATVAGAPPDNNRYTLSGACPPEPSSLAVSVSLTFPLLTGISTLLGPSPCSLADTPPIPDDTCGEGTCTDGICTDCVGTPGADCVAPRGGIQQACCSNDTSRPCFPTSATSDGKLERIGLSTPPEPRWPDPSYPKIAGAMLVGTFCLPPTAVGITTIGSGPGALILPVVEEWRLTPSP